MLKWLDRLISHFAWVPTYFSAEIEVEMNRVTGAYRHRTVQVEGNGLKTGDWVPGLPDMKLYRFDLDDFYTPQEMARRLVPLWGKDDRRKADNDR